MAYTVLALHKDYIRALSGIYSVVNGPVRIYAYATAAKTPFRAADWPYYAAVPVLSSLGFFVGNLGRKYADTDAILAMLLGLVYFSSAILLGSLENGAIAAGWLALTAAWLAVLAALYLKPQWFRCGRRCCRRTS